MSEPIAAKEHEHHTTTIEITGNGQVNAAFEDTEGSDEVPTMRTSPPPPSQIQRPNTPPPQVPRPNTPPPQIPTAQQNLTHMNGDTPHLNGEAKTNGMELRTPGSENNKEVTEAVNLELVNIQPYSNSIPIKKESTELDIGDPYDEYFVPVNQHKKYMRGEKLYVTQDKRRGLGGTNKKCCWGILTVIVLGGIVAILIGVILSSQDNTPVEESRNFNGMRAIIGGGIIPTPSPSSTTQSPRPTTDMSEMYLNNVLQGELTIDNLEFTPGLADHNSSEFKNLAASLEEELKSALFDHQTLHYGSADIIVKVLEFRPGSVVVVYRVGWEFKENIKNPPDPVDKDGLKTKLQEHLRANDGFLYNYRLILHNLKSERITNICKIDNGGCSQDCIFDKNYLKIVCVCKQPFILSDDEKTCIIPENSKSADIPVISSSEQAPHKDDTSPDAVETTFDPTPRPSETEKPVELEKTKESENEPINEMPSSSDFAKPDLSTTVSADTPIEHEHSVVAHTSMEREFSTESELSQEHSNMKHPSLEQEVANQTESPLVTKHIEMKHSTLEYVLPPGTSPPEAENTEMRQSYEETEIPAYTYFPFDDNSGMKHSSLEYEMPSQTESHLRFEHFETEQSSKPSTEAILPLEDDHTDINQDSEYSQLSSEAEHPEKHENSQVEQSSGKLEILSETDSPPKEKNYLKEQILPSQMESSQENNLNTMHNSSVEYHLSSEEESNEKPQPNISSSEMYENVNLMSTGSSVPIGASQSELFHENMTKGYNTSSERGPADQIGVTGMQLTETISQKESTDTLIGTSSSSHPIPDSASSQVNVINTSFGTVQSTTPIYNSHDLITTININESSEIAYAPAMDFHHNESSETPEANNFTNEFISSESSKTTPSLSSERLAKNNQFSSDSAEFGESGFMGTTDYELLTGKTVNKVEEHTVPSLPQYMTVPPSEFSQDSQSSSLSTISVENYEDTSTETFFSPTSEINSKENFMYNQNNNNDTSISHSVINFSDDVSVVNETEVITLNKSSGISERERLNNTSQTNSREKEEIESMTTIEIPRNLSVETFQHPGLFRNDSVSLNASSEHTLLPSLNNDTYGSYFTEPMNSQNIDILETSTSSISEQTPDKISRAPDHTQSDLITTFIPSSFDPLDNISSTENQTFLTTARIEEINVTTEEMPGEADSLLNSANFGDINTNKTERTDPTTELTSSSTVQSIKLNVYEEQNNDGMPPTFLVEGENMPSIALTPNPDLSGPYSVDSTIQPVTEEDDTEEIKSTESFNTKVSSDNEHDHSNHWYDSKNALNSLDDDYHDEYKHANYKFVKGKPEHLGKEYKNIKIEETLRVPQDNDAVEQMYDHRIEQVPTTFATETSSSPESILNAEKIGSTLSLPVPKIKEEEKLLIKEIYTEKPSDSDTGFVTTTDIHLKSSQIPDIKYPEAPINSTEPSVTINPQTMPENDEKYNEMTKLNYTTEITTLSANKEEQDSTNVPEITSNSPNNNLHTAVNITELSNSVQIPSNLNVTVTSVDSVTTMEMETSEAVTFSPEVSNTNLNLSDATINNTTGTTLASLEVVKSSGESQSLTNLNQSIANGGMELSTRNPAGTEMVFSPSEEDMNNDHMNSHNILKESTRSDKTQVLSSNSTGKAEIGLIESKINNTEKPITDITLHPFETLTGISSSISSNNTQETSTNNISEIKSGSLDLEITTTMESPMIFSHTESEVTSSLPGSHKAEPSSTVSA